MARAGLDKETIIKRAAQLANEIGVENITLKVLAHDLKVQPPSLYNHIKGLDDLRKELVIYGWNHMADKILNAVVGISGYTALEALCRAFYQYAVENPGVFNAMLWHSTLLNNELLDSTSKIFSIVYKVTLPLNIPKDTCNHLIRVFHGALEGFALLANNDAFGNRSSINDSFELLLQVLIDGVKTIGGK